tara:strand:- start:1876 stop:2205 length:330 start_codon:yes stop_codon:yes gene_type:complete
MTQERYLEMMEQLGREPVEEEIPPGWQDLPDTVIDAISCFNALGDRVYPDIGYMGKDYTNLKYWMELHEPANKELYLEVLGWLDSRAIKKSSEQMKREMEKLKRKSSGK